MRTSESVLDLLPAFLAARQTIPPIFKSDSAKVGTREYQYADLSTVLDAVLPPLFAEGLIVVQVIEAETSSLLTRLVHVKSGQWIESAYPLALEQAPQSLGSAITYGRRYSILALLSVAAEDDDGATAVAAPPVRTADAVRAAMAATEPQPVPRTRARATGEPDLPRPQCPFCGAVGVYKEGDYGGYYSCPDWKRHQEGTPKWFLDVKKWQSDPASRPKPSKPLLRVPGEEDGDPGF